MTRGKLLLATKDNYIIAVNIDYNSEAEKRRKTLQYQQICENVTYNDFIDGHNQRVQNGCEGTDILSEMSRHLDSDNTEFLNNELKHFKYYRQPIEFHNGLKTNNYPRQPHTIDFDNHIDDEDYPEIIKSLGYKINAVDKTYQVNFNPVTQKYSVNNFYTTRATVYTSEKKIDVIRNHFTFPPSAHAELTTMIAEWQTYLRDHPGTDITDYTQNISSPREQSLFKIYADEQRTVSHRKNTISHEFTHIKNDIMLNGLAMKDNAKRLSVEDVYRINVEDERSAYLDQVINSTNKYLKQGDPNDFTMFDSASSALISHLEALPSSERFACVQNLSNLVEVAFDNFDINHKDNYDNKQFKNNVIISMDSQPLSAQPDTDRSEFFRQRSLMYRFKIYNPQTGRMEDKNLTSLIRPDLEVSITDKVRRDIIIPAKQKLSGNLAKYDRNVRDGRYDPNLVSQAKHLMRDNVRKPRYIDNVDGLEISRLIDENGYTPPQTPNQPREPAEPQTPNNWSGDLKRYWRQVEGYREISDSDGVYSFNINNDKICYTAPNKVEISKNAEYDSYIKLLNEPSNKKRPVAFKDTLSEEQALKLYVACKKCGRKMIGAVPTDLSKLPRLQGIPPEDIQRCQAEINQSANNNQGTNINTNGRNQNTQNMSIINQQRANRAR